MTCKVDECTRKGVSFGYCDGHYRRWKRTGDPGPATFKTLTPRVGSCSVGECGRTIYASGMCSPHYQRRLTKGDALAGRPVLPAPECDGENRRCRRCREVKPVNGFEAASHATKHICIDCEASAKLSKRYGITAGQYDQMLHAQGGVCAICEEPPGRDGRFRKLAVDHDHACCDTNRSCGKCVRGLLCRRCNFGLAGFRDRIELLHKAETYLVLATADQADPKKGIDS